MKTLTQLNEDFKISSTIRYKTPFFVYKLDETDYIRVFNPNWAEYHKFKNHVYLNGEHLTLNSGKTSEKYGPGKYNIEILNIDEIFTCNAMFLDCAQLSIVPEFDTHKVSEMCFMFENCKNLISIPEFDTTNVVLMQKMFANCVNISDVPLIHINRDCNMYYMFIGCNRLSNETKHQWSQIYDFNKHIKK